MSFNTFVDKGQNIPNYRERKQILYRDPAFQPNLTVILDTSTRSSGTINNPTWNLPTPVQSAYAVSMKSMSIPVSWPNVTATQTFTVVYGANPSNFPHTVYIAPGRYSYDPEIGILTWATVSAAPGTSFTDDIMYCVMRAFNGAINNITVNAATGVWIWNWDPSCDYVDSSSPAVSTFFKVSIQSGLDWQGGNIDLTGPKCIVISCSDLVSNGYISPVTPYQSYLCSCPTGNVQSGDVILHVPPMEKITFFGSAGQYIAKISLAIIDASTNLLLPLTADWCTELKLYIDVKQ
jgi:hypothetical protein